MVLLLIFARLSIIRVNFTFGFQPHLQGAGLSTRPLFQPGVDSQSTLDFDGSTDNTREGWWINHKFARYYNWPSTAGSTFLSRFGRSKHAWYSFTSRPTVPLCGQRILCGSEVLSDAKWLDCNIANTLDKSGWHYQAASQYTVVEDSYEVYPLSGWSAEMLPVWLLYY